MPTLAKKLPPSRRLARVIRDVRDGTKDYFITETRATQLYAASHLDIVRGPSGRYDFATQHGEVVK